MAPLQQQPSGVVLLVASGGSGRNTPTAVTTTQRRGQTQDLWRAMYATKGKGQQEEEALDVQDTQQQPMSKQTKASRQGGREEHAPSGHIPAAHGPPMGRGCAAVVACCMMHAHSQVSSTPSLPAAAPQIALVVACIVFVAAATTCIVVALAFGRPGAGANSAPSAPVPATPAATVPAPKPVVAAVPPPPPPPPIDPTKPQFAVPAGFKALWWDEFSGPALNTSKWSYVTPAGQDASSEGVQKYTASADNVRQEGGVLLITSLRGPDGTYTSGRLDSRPSGAWFPGQKVS